MRAPWRLTDDVRERGATAVLVAIMLLVLFVSVSFVVDIGMQVFRRQAVRNAMDSSALAGAALLPKDPAGAKAAAIRFALDNDPQLTAATVAVSFRCLVGDRDGDSRADNGDVPAVCDPGANGTTGFVCDRGICTAPCNPDEGDVCNTVVTQASEDVDFKFAPLAGIGKGTTGDVRAAACSGYCGNAPRVPTDIGIVIDRTASMSATDLANAKQAALSTLQFFDPAYDQIALGVIHRSSATSRCSSGAYGRSISTADFTANRGTWIAAPYPSGSLFTDYQRSDTTPNPNSMLVKTIQCLETSSFSTANGQTDIGSPIQAMANLLKTRGRAGVKKAMIVETDGEANLPAGTQPCGFAVSQGDAAGRSGIEIFTIGFGIGGKRCSYDTTGKYANALVTKVLADASYPVSDDNGCVAAENDDGDHFFCEPKSADLRAVFLKVASAITSVPRLVRIAF